MKIPEPHLVLLLASSTMALGLGGCATSTFDHRSTSPSKGTAVWEIASAPVPAATGVRVSATTGTAGGA